MELGIIRTPRCFERLSHTWMGIVFHLCVHMSKACDPSPLFNKLSLLPALPLWDSEGGDWGLWPAGANAVSLLLAGGSPTVSSPAVLSTPPVLSAL